MPDNVRAPGTRTNKVLQACNRCRKQKLKCDISRPCTLCTRSGTFCTSSDRPPRRGHAGPRDMESRKRHSRLQPDREQSHTEHATIQVTPVQDQQPDVNPVRNFARSEGSSDAESIQPTATSPCDSAQGGQRTSNTAVAAFTGEDITANNVPRNFVQIPAVLPRLSRDENPRLSHNSFAGDSSAIGLTKEVFGFNDSQHHSLTSALPGGVDRPSPLGIELISNIHLPPREVVIALMDTYFDTVHWFMFVLHEPSFRSNTERIMGPASNLTAADADFAALLMMVLALGAQYAAKNPGWHSTALLERHSIDLTTLNHSLIRQVRAHLLDSLERCQVEAVQICILLGTFYLYHGSPSVSWSILGMAVKSSYALAMHREVDWRGSQVLLQVRKRAWAHTFIADTFAAVVYGRPSTVDRDFCDVSFPDEFDDTEIPFPLQTYVALLNDGKKLSKLSFHTNKYLLYDIKSQIIKKIYTLRGRAAFSMKAGGIGKLVSIVQSLDKKLKDWYKNLPTFFKHSAWKDGDRDSVDVLDKINEDLPADQEIFKRHLNLQVITLQVSYDNILILLHRPLLEYKLSSQRNGPSPTSSNNPFAYSFDSCISAALRISCTPLVKLEYDLPLALISMHMFTAGVILCIPATVDPFSQLAHTAKGAVVRIIRVFKKLAIHTPIAAQSHTILEELMKVVLRRELDMVLQPEDHGPGYEEHSAFKTRSQVLEHDSMTRDHWNSMRSPVRHVSIMNNATNNQIPGTSYEPKEQQFELQEFRSTGIEIQRDPASLDHLPNVSEVVLPSARSARSDGVQGNLYQTFDGSPSGISIYEMGNEQPYSDLYAERDQGFNSAFGALEKVIYDFAPPEWLDPLWMHPQESNGLLPESSSGQFDNLTIKETGGSEASAIYGLRSSAPDAGAGIWDYDSRPQERQSGVSTPRHTVTGSLHGLSEAGPSWLWGLNRIT